ncbi:MAG: class I SAM-dependent methyltransferase [Gallionella sp.]|nr:class I SAM-dependent methyltransferase [Gallionella sp.]
MNIWNERYAGEHYHFGTEPNAFLSRQKSLLNVGERVLAIADGEGRNGVWLAQQGLQVVAVDASDVAIAKAKKLAQQRGVSVQFELADLMAWDWGVDRYDVVVGIFIQFAPPGVREQMFERIKQCLKPGGLLLLEGYAPRQIGYKTGGPSQVENLYTVEQLREAFADLEIVELRDYDAEIEEGPGHKGISALVDLVARKR